MAMLAWPWDDEVSLELVDRTDGEPVVAGGFDHLAIQVDDLEATRRNLMAAGLDVGVVEIPAGRGGPRTTAVVDPDGYRLELVQWPARHPVAMTRGDFNPVTHPSDPAPDVMSTKETQK